MSCYRRRCKPTEQGQTQGRGRRSGGRNACFRLPGGFCLKQALCDAAARHDGSMARVWGPGGLRAALNSPERDVFALLYEVCGPTLGEPEARRRDLQGTAAVV